MQGVLFFLEGVILFLLCGGNLLLSLFLCMLCLSLSGSGLLLSLFYVTICGALGFINLGLSAILGCLDAEFCILLSLFQGFI